MMARQTRQLRVLGIAPTTRGFGYALLEVHSNLADWGTTEVRGDKNARSLTKIIRMMELFQPDLLLLPDVQAPGTHRAPRIKELCTTLQSVAEARKLKVKFVSRAKVCKALLGVKDGTKQDLAQKLAELFPAELGQLLPPKRRLWESEDRRMDIFDAVGVVVGSLGRGS